MNLIIIFTFLLEFVGASFLLYFVYLLLLRYKVSYGFCRIYLTSIPIIALVASVYTFEILPSDHDLKEGVEVAAPNSFAGFIENNIYLQSDILDVVPSSDSLQGISTTTPVIEISKVDMVDGQDMLSSETNTLASGVATASGVSLINGIPTTSSFRYVVISILMLSLLFALIKLIVLAIQVKKILSIKQWSTREMYNGTVIYRSGLIDGPFSFIRDIYVARSIDGDKLKMIVEHEKSHVANHHYIDKCIIELLSVLLWFNPAIWVIRKEIGAIHEFQADSEVVNGGVDLRNYKLYLFEEIATESPIIANGFNHSMVKKRLIILGSNRSTNFVVVRTIIASLALVAIFVSLSCVSANTLNSELVATNEVVVDNEAVEDNTVVKSNDAAVLVISEAKDYDIINSLIDKAVENVVGLSNRDIVTKHNIKTVVNTDNEGTTTTSTNDTTIYDKIIAVQDSIRNEFSKYIEEMSDVIDANSSNAKYSKEMGEAKIAIAELRKELASADIEMATERMQFLKEQAGLKLESAKIDMELAREKASILKEQAELDMELSELTHGEIGEDMAKVAFDIAKDAVEIAQDIAIKVWDGVSNLEPVDDKYTREDTYVIPAYKLKGLPDYILYNSKNVKELKSDRIIGIKHSKTETFVDFTFRPAYDSHWCVFSSKTFLKDKRTDDMYKIRRIEGEIPLDKILWVNGYRHSYVTFTLVFPRLADNVKIVDFIEHRAPQLVYPKNSVGDWSYKDIYIKDFEKAAKMKAKIIK